MCQLGSRGWQCMVVQEVQFLWLAIHSWNGHMCPAEALNWSASHKLESYSMRWSPQATSCEGSGPQRVFHVYCAAQPLNSLLAATHAAPQFLTGERQSQQYPHRCYCAQRASSSQGSQLWFEHHLEARPALPAECSFARQQRLYAPCNIQLTRTRQIFGV